MAFIIHHTPKPLLARAVPRGQVLIVALVMLTLVVALSGGAMAVANSVSRASLSVARTRIVNEAAAAGIDRALWCLEQTLASLCGGSAGSDYSGETGIALGAARVSIETTVINSETRAITATATYADRTEVVSATAQRRQDGISFIYATQVGDGGLEMEGGTTVNGDVFSNGSVTGASSKRSTISGNVSVASTTIDKVKVLGDARASTITNSVITHDAHYQTISDTDVQGAAYPGTPPPPPQPLPISDSLIESWRSDARAGGTIAGDYAPENGAIFSLGPTEITGELLLDNNQTMTITGTVYVQGGITIDNNTIIKLDPAYGANSGVLFSDGPIHIKNNGIMQGAGPGSFVILLSTAAGGGHHDSAIDLHNNADGAIFYAGNGLINLHNNVHVGQLTAKKIYLSENAVLNYNTAMANANFVSTPAGRWVLVPGTWREVR